MSIINRETDYALRVLARLAGRGETMSVSSLAELEDVPERFLSKTMQRLARAGIVQSQQGPFGGYGLARPPEGVSLLEVIEVVQGPLVMNECFSEPEICRRTRLCPFRARLAELQVELNASLSGISLADIAEARRSGEPAAPTGTPRSG